MLGSAAHRKCALVFWSCLPLAAAGCVGQIDSPWVGAAAGADAGGTGGNGADGGMGGGGSTSTPMGCRSPGTIDFFRDIQPILADNCVRCHGGVRLLPAPTADNPNAVPFNIQASGDPHTQAVLRSLLLARVKATDPRFRMPLNGPPLGADQIDKLERWVGQGAPWPEHWAFAPLAKIDPAQVPVSDQSWVRQPIDRFVLSRLDQQGIKPSAETDRRTLIRRVSLDLTGLPPTPTEVDGFVGDVSATAYEKVVDRLLASQSFGERWGRHWLDQARYADSNGYAGDDPRFGAYQWRDWVINAVNQDMPFDKFTVAQFADDIGGSGGTAVPTAFHTQTLFNAEGGTNREEDRTKRVIDRVATVGQTWLGLTLGCAQCHGHPYDPISQKEFYRLFAFFNNADESPPYDDESAGNGVLRVLQERTNATSTRDADGLVVQGRRKTFRLFLANHLTPDTEELTPAVPAVLNPLVPRNSAQPDRLDLGRWLVDKANPVTPRVAINTIWYHLFGQGLVTSLDDFGARATLPGNPDLLDWLASDFQSHWSRKKLIRKIVLSATYRQSSAFRPDVDTPTDCRDPGNALLHRQNRVRVEAEIVWDLYLASGGLLHLPAKVGGPGIYPPIAPELLGLFYIDGNPADRWPTSDVPLRYRRGLYIFHFRTVPYPALHVFDLPEADASVTGRSHSDTPLQALTRLHNEVFVEAARAFARRIQVEQPGSVDERITYAFRVALARPPSPEELTIFTTLYNDSKVGFGVQDATDAVGAQTPPGADPLDAAAWVSTARTILNLNEFITRD